MPNPKKRFPAEYMRKIALRVMGELSPHCQRIEIVGSLRRKRSEVSDIDLICIPQTEPGPDLFAHEEQRIREFVKTVDHYKKVKGDAEKGKYCARIDNETGVSIEIYICNYMNWGLMKLIRTGGANFSKHIIGTQIKKFGYYSRDGYLRDVETGNIVPLDTEDDLFDLIEMDYVRPEHRA